MDSFLRATAIVKGQKVVVFVANDRNAHYARELAAAKDLLGQLFCSELTSATFHDRIDARLLCVGVSDPQSLWSADVLSVAAVVVADGALRIRLLFTQQAHRKLGFARLLLESAIGHAQACGVKTAVAEASDTDHLNKFWACCGFQRMDAAARRAFAHRCLNTVYGSRQPLYEGVVLFQRNTFSCQENAWAKECWFKGVRANGKHKGRIAAIDAGGKCDVVYDDRSMDRGLGVEHVRPLEEDALEVDGAALCPLCSSMQSPEHMHLFCRCGKVACAQCLDKLTAMRGAAECPFCRETLA